MASVPNMRPGLAPTPAGKPGAAIVDGGEFARAIALVPEELLQVAAPIESEGEDAPAPEIAEAGITTPDAPADPAAIVVAIAPLLEAQVAAPAPKAEPAIAAAVAATPAPVTVEPRKAPQPKVAAPKSETEAEAELPLPEGEAKPAPADPREKEAIAAAKRMLDAAPEPAARPARQVAPATPAVARPVAEIRQQPDLAVTAPVMTIAPAPTDIAPTRTNEAPAPAPTRTLDLSRESEWLDRLARDIAQAAGNEGTIRFRLHPQTLGHLRVELSQGDHGTSIRVTADTEQARAIIADAQPRLAAEARAQGLRIAETHVDLSGSDRQASGDPRRQDEARQTPLIRTARAAAADAQAPERPGATRSDRFA